MDLLNGNSLTDFVLQAPCGFDKDDEYGDEYEDESTDCHEAEFYDNVEEGAGNVRFPAGFGVTVHECGLYDIVIGKELGCKSSAEERACQGESEFAHPFEDLVAGAAARHFVTIGVTGPDVEADKYGEEDHEDEVGRGAGF